jgi:hypothetical protein
MAGQSGRTSDGASAAGKPFTPSALLPLVRRAHSGRFPSKCFTLTWWAIDMAARPEREIRQVRAVSVVRRLLSYQGRASRAVKIRPRSKVWGAR